MMMMMIACICEASIGVTQKESYAVKAPPKVLSARRIRKGALSGLADGGELQQP